MAGVSLQKRQSSLAASSFKPSPTLFPASHLHSGSEPTLLKSLLASILNQLLTDLKEKWDAVENKSTVILYGRGAMVAVWLTSVVVGAINSVPLLPKILELVGLGYRGWKELAEETESLKKKIAGAE